jgi:hypothetical protein
MLIPRNEVRANDLPPGHHPPIFLEAVEELVIVGTAVQIMLASLMHNDMTIAVEGPEGAERWKYQEPNWLENEDNDVEEDDNE